MVELHPMTGGDGTYSCIKNSSVQRQSISNAKNMIDETITRKLEIKAPKTFKIADLGCSVGPNAFICVVNIIQAVKFKYQKSTTSYQIPEFQVVFNDHTFNDFNTLFTSIPPEKPYFAAGVPGSFHQRLFPENSLHFVHSSHALHWLSHLPMELLDTNSPAWNKGRIFYHSAPEAVIGAYATQFARDVEVFLNVRAKELVEGGIMVLIFPLGITRDAISHSCAIGNMMMFDALGSCLMDMAKQGSVRESLVDSFNLPMYFPSANEMSKLVEKNGCFKIEKLELYYAKSDVEDDMLSSRIEWVMCLRDMLGGLLTTHFGNEIMDELFDRFLSKLEQLQTRPIQEAPIIFLALKRNSSPL